MEPVVRTLLTVVENDGKFLLLQKYREQILPTDRFSIRGKAE